ncbi:MAG: glycosyltransferase involved in cell wall biosynthesis [Rhodothermales bacterium]|jgi:glycosyltransferase involved in cell wall biosynthesis
MRIIQITPGTGTFYCGSCLRDHALVSELQARGHDVTMVPMYLPLVLDGEKSPDSPLFFGGINVYLQQKSAFFRKLPGWADKIFDNESLLRLASKNAGMTKPRDLGELCLSTLRGEEGKQVKEIRKLIDWLREEPPADLIVLSNAMLAGLARSLKAALGLPVVCTLQGEDTFLDSLPPELADASWATLRERMADVDAVVAVSQYYGDLMTERLALPPEKMHVVHNGIAIDDVLLRSSLPEPAVIGYLAAMCRGKGLDILADAFIRLKADDRIPGLQLRVIGTVTKADEPYLAEIVKRLESAEVMCHVSFHRNVSRAEKLSLLSTLSVLSVPADYGEAFGLYVLEALAAGVPVVQPNHAAFPEILAATGGGRLCEVRNPEDLARVLGELLADPKALLELGNAGKKAVEKNFTAQAMAIRAEAVYTQVI